MTKKIIFLAILLTAGALYFLNRNDTIVSWHLIDVNYGRLQGDANLLIIGDTTVMIDAGYAQEAKIAVLPYLQKLGIKKIDHFFISHPHRDHYEGLAPIIDSGIHITNLYYKLPAAEIEDCCYDKDHFLKFVNYAKDHGTNLFSPDSGFKLDLGKAASIELLHAQEGNLPETKLDVNDLSLVMRLTVNDRASVLFPGDLNLGVGTYLTGDVRMQADYLKMPHHGLASIAPNSFFETVDPKFVLVPGPTHLWCDERGDQAREWTDSNKVPTWINGLNGHVVVEFRRNQTTVFPEREGADCVFSKGTSGTSILNNAASLVAPQVESKP